MLDKELQITLLTDSKILHHQAIELLKNIIRYCFWRKIYGPMGVLKSLDRGFQSLQKAGRKLTFNINPPTSQVYPIVFALRWADTLAYALNLKKKGKIKKLFAGPNISVPKDKHDNWFHSEVDQIIVPSQRVFDYHCSLDERLRSRMFIWPAGVQDQGAGSKTEHSLIVFKKNAPDSLTAQILDSLEQQGISYHLLEYGKFLPSDYQALLNISSAMIYLQESETQGLALQEAWMKDIPTLVRDRGYWDYQGRYWEGNQISCPYLTPEVGMRFADFSAFKESFSIFWQKALAGDFTPRSYTLAELSDHACAQKLLQSLCLSDF